MMVKYVDIWKQRYIIQIERQTSVYKERKQEKTRRTVAKRNDIGRYRKKERER